MYSEDEAVTHWRRTVRQPLQPVDSCLDGLAGTQSYTADYVEPLHEDLSLPEG